MDAHLKDEELQNPYLVLDKVFGNFSLPEIRTELKNIEKEYLESSFPVPIKSSTPYDNVLHFFENLDKLVQASYLHYDNLSPGRPVN
jgi:hypothetical protein